MSEVALSLKLGSTRFVLMHRVRGFIQHSVHGFVHLRVHVVSYTTESPLLFYPIDGVVPRYPFL